MAGGLADVGKCLVFSSKGDWCAAMTNYEFDGAKGGYTNPAEDIFDSFKFDDDEQSSSGFPPKISEYTSTDMSMQPGITMDKARTDIFTQYKHEFKRVNNIIKHLSDGL